MKSIIEKETNFGNVYFLKIGKIRYLKSKNCKKDCCQICGKKRKTTAHHLIPKRLHCICPILSEIRIRVCSKCDVNFHPENKFIRKSDVVKRQSKKISNLQEAIYWRDNKMRTVVKGLNKIEKDTSALLGLRDEDFYITKCNKIIQKEVNRDDK